MKFRISLNGWKLHIWSHPTRYSAIVSLYYVECRSIAIWWIWFYVSLASLSLHTALNQTHQWTCLRALHLLVLYFIRCCFDCNTFLTGLVYVTLRTKSRNILLINQCGEKRQTKGDTLTDRQTDSKTILDAGFWWAFSWFRCRWSSSGIQRSKERSSKSMNEWNETVRFFTLHWDHRDLTCLTASE